MGRPKIYNKVINVTTCIPETLHKLAEELHISWSMAMRTGIKILSQGGDEPTIPQETIEKHLKIEKHLTEAIDKQDSEIKVKDDAIERLNKILNSNVRKKEETKTRDVGSGARRGIHY